MATRIFNLSFLLVGYVLAAQLSVEATVAPSKEQLRDGAHLVVIGLVTDVVAPQKGQEYGKVTVDIIKIEKGHWNSKKITFVNSMTGETKGDSTVDSWKTLIAKKCRFYLFNPNEDARYKDAGLTDWILSDSWFGYERLE